MPLRRRLRLGTGPSHDAAGGADHAECVYIHRRSFLRLRPLPDLRPLVASGQGGEVLGGGELAGDETGAVAVLPQPVAGDHRVLVLTEHVLEVGDRLGEGAAPPCPARERPPPRRTGTASPRCAPGGARDRGNRVRAPSTARRSLRHGLRTKSASSSPSRSSMARSSMARSWIASANFGARDAATSWSSSAR